MKTKHFLTATSMLGIAMTTANTAVAGEIGNDNIKTIESTKMTGIRQVGVIALATTAGYDLRQPDLKEELETQFDNVGLSFQDLTADNLVDAFIHNTDFRVGIERIADKQGDSVSKEFNSLKAWLEAKGYDGVGHALSEVVADPSLRSAQLMMNLRVRHEFRSGSSTSSTTAPNTTAGVNRDAVPAG